MRVAVLGWTGRHAGGVESYVAALLGSLREAGLDVAFFHEEDAPADRPAIAVPEGMPVFSGARAGRDAALAALRDWRPDVLYSQGLHDVDCEASALTLAPSVMFVHTYTGTCISGTKTHTYPAPAVCPRVFGAPCLALYLPRGCGGSSPVTMWRLYRTQQRRRELLGRHRLVITHSRHMSDELRAHGVDARVVPFPVSTCEVPPRADEPACDVLFAGRMDPQKGGVFLLDALPVASRALGRPLRAVFAGDGPDRARWEARAREIQAAEPRASISFTGWLDEPRLGALMRGSRLLVMPSVWPEPLGTVGIAAGRYGVPAAAFSVGGIPQWLREGVNGHLAGANPPTAEALAEVLVKCLASPAHHGELSAGARRIAAEFTMDRHLPALLEVLALAKVRGAA